MPKPIPESIQEECQDQDNRRCQQHAQPFRCVSARLVYTSEFFSGEMGAGTTSFQSIAHAHAVVVLVKNEKRTTRRGLQDLKTDTFSIAREVVIQTIIIEEILKHCGSVRTCCLGSPKNTGSCEMNWPRPEF